jgi:hypothetical protein
MPEVASGGRKQIESGRSVPFSRIVGFWAPRRFVTDAGIDVEAFVSDINDKIQQRGFVLYDGQILTKPLDPAESIEPTLEAVSSPAQYQVPDRRQWQSEQRDYFGLNDPYQMADEPDAFTWSHITACVVESYLGSGELIAGLLHGEVDNSYFTCPCHYATVVYTTRQRLICMSCGATHVVLREPLAIATRQILTADEWVELFDDDGSRHHEEVDLAIVDFRDIENAATIWTTNQWDEAVHEFVFFARSSPEEIAEAIRGTEADPSILLEAGWTQVEQAPPPALQLLANSFDVNLFRNAEHAFAQGVAAFLNAYVRPESLLSAVPQLFRAIELLLKARLELVDAHGLDDQPNNPTVLDRLRARGINLHADETDTVIHLRRLRNDLQHDTATFNHRTGLALCRQAVIFVDRFVDEELGMWVADAISGSDWQALLDIPEIASRGERIAESRLTAYRNNQEASITTCRRCGREAMLRPHSATGASCVYCRDTPVLRDD